MKTGFSAPRRSLLLLIVVAALLLVAPASYANVRTEAVIPYYARIGYEELYHNDEWAAIVFYRLPDCVPDDFNLLEFYDFAGAFGCEPTTDGFLIWAGEPWVSAPIQMELHGLGDVPVWFMTWPDLQVAIADGSLTMPELEAIPSLLIGSASFYNETLHPAAVVPMINYVAHGLLADGRSFQVHATWPEGAGAGLNMSIVFE